MDKYHQHQRYQPTNHKPKNTTTLRPQHKFMEQHKPQNYGARIKKKKN